VCAMTLFDRLRKLDSPLQTIIGAVLLFSVYWAYQWFGTATIEISSEPPGAKVTVDSRQRGVTPLDRVEVDSGSHGVVVEHSHYKPYRENISLRRGDHENRHIVLSPGEGTLELLSNPRGAWVEVDGERISGRTPTSYVTSSGPHEIKMGQEERHIIAETHTLKHDQTLEVNFNLNIDPHGSLTITTQPRSAKVTFLDVEETYAPNMRLGIGEYAFRVARSGYITQEFRYKVRYGSNLHMVKLERGFGHLVVRAQPSNAEVTVSYDLDGKTKRLGYQSNMQVPIGRVEIRTRAIGYRTSNRNITMGLKGATVNLNLTAMQVQVGQELGDGLRSGGQAPTMVIMPAGEFVMGDDTGSFSEKPARTVVLTQPFAVSKTEVRIADYLLFAKATGKAMPVKLNTQDPNVAMAYVSYEDAHGYIQWLSKETGEKYRMLSEAEWEYVARAGSTSDYFFGNDPLQLCQFANVADQSVKQSYSDWQVLDCDDGMVRVSPVGQLAAHPFGLYDIYGNVSEWVSDCGMESYQKARRDGLPTEEGVGCATHGFRGGSWDSGAAEAKSVYRNSASSAIDDRGIRIARDL
jgi:formylglycine-generating enzyme required for sulfatase activity